VRELEDLIFTWRALPAGTPAVLATVVATSGSTYRRAGARMLLTREQWLAGSISGGCLEGDAIRSAWDRTKDGPALVTYDSTADEDIVWGFGLGCNGVVQVLFERLPENGGVLAFLSECFAHRQTAVVRTVISSANRLGCREWKVAPQASEGIQTESADGEQWLVETISPPRPIVICGGGHDAIPLVSIAKAVGWHVTVVDARPTFAQAARFPGADRVVCAFPSKLEEQVSLDETTALVAMNHHYLNDLAVLKLAIKTNVPYIGLLGPRRRTERLLEDLRREGIEITAEDEQRLHSPIGLDIGAEGPDEIALAISSEIQAVFAARPGSSLRGRQVPLHPTIDAVVNGATVEQVACQVS